MKAFFASVLVLVLALAAASDAQAKLRVVGTLPDFAALASEVGGERVEAQSLVVGTQDPHFADARPSFVVLLNRADLLIYAGMGLEDGWLPPLITQARNGAILPGGSGSLDASTAVSPREVPANPDRAMGDVHPAGNPHFYTSPEELLKVARRIAQVLATLDPEGRAGYEQRLAAFEQRYQEKAALWRRRLAPLQGAPVVVYHRSFVYFLDWAGLREVGALEPKPGVPPSAGHVARLIAAVRDQKVRFLLQEPYQPRRLSELFAEKTGAKLLVLPSMVGGAPGVETVLGKFDRIVDLLSPE